MNVYFVATVDYTIREETLEDRRHLVVPVIMMVEGVHNGSHGPVYHRADELSRQPEVWNNIPVMVGHPQVDGRFVSARNPEVSSTSVGRVINSHFDGKLRAEAWLDEQKLLAVSPETAGYLRQGRPVDVSVGTFNDSDYTEGEWNGETYVSIAYNYRPDHLALLPGERGACSWEDGCGIRVNMKGGSMDDLLKSFKELSQKGYVVSPLNNEEGFTEISNLLQTKLDTMDTADRRYYLEEVYSDAFVYRVRSNEGGSTLYKRGYTFENGAVNLSEDYAEVRKKVEYVTMEMRRTKPPVVNSKNKRSMAKDDSPCCEAKVDALIANKETMWTAKDRAWLMEQDESTIEKLSYVAPKEENDPPQVNKEEVIDEFKESLKTIEDYTALMPEEMKAQIDAGVKMYQEKRKALLKSIVDNSDFEEDELKTFSDQYLEKLAKSVSKEPTDYSGQGAGGGNGEADDDEILYPAGYVESKK
jgi:hypothetical protein